MKISVNVKMEENVRNEAKTLFDSMGLDMTTAVNLFVRTAIREKRIPFLITAENSDELQNRFENDLALDLNQAEKEVRTGQTLNFHSVIEKVKKDYELR